MSTIDQDGLSFESIVWFGSGEVVGNQVTTTVSSFDRVFTWFVRVQDPGGFTTAATGLEVTLDDAVDAASSSMVRMLGVWDEDEEQC